ncbi:hypothetical protein [Haloarcula amylolytica]|uniref:hypothetical protein n=1 Tax=Haloarcula amylolytica TaxID=396317 RepID=UPI003C76A06A
MTFDPKHEPASSRRRSKIKKMYKKLVNRGNEEAAEELRDQDSTAAQVRYLNDVDSFDPKYDEDTDNSAKVAIKNTYDILLELGHDELAEELRSISSVKRARRFVMSEIVPAVDAEIEPMTGRFEPAEDDSPSEEEASG